MTKAALAESQSSVSQSVISHSPSTSSREQGQQSAPAPEQPAPAPTCVPATPVMSTWRSAACFGAAHSAHEDQRQAVAYHTRTGVQQPAPWICLLTAARPCRPSVHLPRLAYARRLSSVGRHRRTVVSASPLPASARRQPMALGGHCSQTSTRLTSSSSPAQPNQTKPTQTKHNTPKPISHRRTGGRATAVRPPAVVDFACQRQTAAANPPKGAAALSKIRSKHTPLT